MIDSDIRKTNQTDRAAFIRKSPKKNQEEWSFWREANYAYFIEKLGSPTKSKTLLDLGAGALHFEDLFTQFSYVGVDFMEYPHVSVVTDLTKKIPLPDQHADIVTLSNVLEHIPNTEEFLYECWRLLKPEGFLVGTIPFLLSEHQAPYDFNRYTHFQLKRFLAKVGFKNIEIRPLGNQLDVYETIEQKTFDQLYLHFKRRSVLLKCARVWRSGEMQILRWLFGAVPANEKVTEGYGFSAMR
jgi:SAM-dependent methyltransferase